MSPLTHLLASWVIAVHATDNPRDCRLVTLAGIAPDLDGLGLLVDMIRPALGLKPSNYYQWYHHYLFHGVFGAVLVALLAAALARRRWRVLLLSLLVFHLHLLCDFVGSRGPSDVDLWPIFYFGPFDKDPMWIWKGQWPLEAWPNRLITLGLFAWSLWLAVTRGHSVVGVFNRRADAVFIGVLQKWKTRLAGGEVTQR